MGQITSGHILYGRTVKVAEYESKRAEVQFDFVVDDGETYIDIANQAGDGAVSKCHEMLGISVPPKAASKPAAKKPVAKAVPTTADPAAIEEKAAPAKAKPKKLAKKAASKADPAAMGDDFDAPGEGDDGGTTRSPEPFADVEPVTDADLNHCCQEAKAAGVEVQKIRDIVASYREDPSQPMAVRGIPQEKRAEFILRVEALKAKGKK